MKRAVGYARVSTDKEDQKNSLEAQIEYFKAFIKSSKEYEFIDIYYDEGISGTSTKKRTGFLKMIKDAKDKKFDIILTKEVSRFARNTVDTLTHTRELKKNGVGVIFTIDNINTLDNEGELRLSLMATLAQEESRKISERVKWGQKQKQKAGVVFGTAIYGYDLVDGKLIINEEEAKIVRLIYTLYAEGNGLNIISDELNKRNVPTKRGMGKWENTTITRILENEKYIGKLVSRKFKRTDFIDWQVVKTNNEERFTFENNHDAIISEKLWNIVQEEKRKRNKYKDEDKKYSNRYVYSSKIDCECGSTYTRKLANKTTPFWCCRIYGSKGRKGCSYSNTYREIFLDKGISMAYDELKKTKDDISDGIKNILKSSLKSNSNVNQIKNLTKEIDKLKKRLLNYQEMRADGEISKDDFKKLSNDTKVLITEKEKELNKLTQNDNIIIGKFERLDKFISILGHLDNNDIDKDEVFSPLIEKIVPIDENTFIVKTILGVEYKISKKVKHVKYDGNFEVFIEPIIYPFSNQTRYISDEKDINELLIFNDCIYNKIVNIQ